MQEITPCLWFDNVAEEAANFYVSIFKNSRIGTITRYGEAGAKASGRPEGTADRCQAEACAPISPSAPKDNPYYL